MANEEVTLESNVQLQGFASVEPAAMTVLRKIIGNHYRRLAEISDAQGLNISSDSNAKGRAGFLDALLPVSPEPSISPIDDCNAESNMLGCRINWSFVSETEDGRDKRASDWFSPAYTALMP